MEPFDWSKTLADLIPQDWRDTRGAGVKLALIDTGVESNIHSVAHLIKDERCFFTGKTGFTIFDRSGRDDVSDGFGGSGHGTKYAGVLAGRSAPDKEDLLDGIAKDADFFIIKARHISGEFTSIKDLLNGIELAAELGIEVAVIGQTILANEIQAERITEAEIQRVMQKAEAAGMLIFSTIKNLDPGETWTGAAGTYFPSGQTQSINVAKAPSDINNVRSQITGQNIHFLLGGFEGKSYSAGNRFLPIKMSNSGAVAIMGGIATLCLSWMKSQNPPLPVDRAAVLAKIREFCQPLSTANGTYPAPIIFTNF